MLESDFWLVMSASRFLLLLPSSGVVWFDLVALEVELVATGLVAIVLLAVGLAVADSVVVGLVVTGLVAIVLLVAGLAVADPLTVGLVVTGVVGTGVVVVVVFLTWPITRILSVFRWVLHLRLQITAANRSCKQLVGSKQGRQRKKTKRGDSQ